MPRPTFVRKDGETVGGADAPNRNPAGQPNGKPFRPADVPKGLPYGEGGAIRSAVAATPPGGGVGTPGSAPPPGVSPAAHAAHMALRDYKPNLTPLFAPTERPNEHPMTGAPGPAGVGDVNPMAIPGGAPSGSVSTLLAQMAQATSSPTLQALTAQAQALGQ